MEYQNELAVLDQGFVALVDFMGGDLAVVQAARVSYGGTLKDAERDKKLIDYLMANKHETPFEHSVFKFHIKCPIFVARQWFRHRISSYNEISGRYTKMKEEFYLPEILRAQKAKNYKFSDVDHETNTRLKAKITEAYEFAYQLYKELLDEGVAKEHARIVLPLALYTQFYWTINARSLLNFLSLRMDEHAQYEIRQYANVINEIFKEKMPWTHDAFNKYIIRGEQWDED